MTSAQKSIPNVFLVDWSTLGESVSYMQTVASVPLMSEMLSQLIQKLDKNWGLSAARLRLIGHSVGAHIAGLTAERLKKKGFPVAHLLALDPSGPFFRSTELTDERLDKKNALFVECWYSGRKLSTLPNWWHQSIRFN